MDLAVKNTTLIPFRTERPEIIPNGTVGITDGEITFVGPDEDFAATPDETIDGEQQITIPGLVNTHVHTGHTVLRGCAQDVPEIQWMTDALGPLSRHASQKDHIAGSKLGVLEGVLSGVTTFGEYAESVASLVESVYEPWGIRVAATETINGVSNDRDDGQATDPYSFDVSAAQQALTRADELADNYADQKLVEPMYGPQAVDMVPQDILRAAFDHALERDCRVHVHVAQGQRERLQIESRYGDDVSSVDVLAQAGMLDERLIAVHCHDTTQSERARLANAGASYIACPGSIAAIDGRVPPIEQFRELGCSIGLGTDQAPGPGGHDFIREVRTAALLAKTEGEDPSALPAWHALRLATREGARAIGMDEKIGSIAVGKRADLVMIDCHDPAVAPITHSQPRSVIPNLVYSAGRAGVDTVMVDGNVVVRNGEFEPADRTAVVEAATRRAQSLVENGEEDWRRAGSALVEAVEDGWL